MSGVLTAGDRIRAIVQLGRAAREADAQLQQAWEAGAPYPHVLLDTLQDEYAAAAEAITDHLAALEATGVLECIAEAADLFEGGRA